MYARLALAALLAAGLTACGAGTAATTPSGSIVTSGAYAAVSDVAPHAAIGGDVAAIKELLGAAKEGKPVDWAEVSERWTRGGASTKSDGSTRTLAKLVDDADATGFVADAIAGVGAARGATDAVRAQQVDKGITVLLAAKVRDELASARAKIEKGETGAEKGAPHNVDEAWAFFTAGGNGVDATARKRAADFDRPGMVAEPVLAALTAAQRAAGAGDLAAFDTAAAEVDRAIHVVFYLATYKYLETKGDPVRAAEGAAFYRGIAPVVRAADSSADQAITAAFASGDTAAGRAALHRDGVLRALGIDAGERVTG